MATERIERRLAAILAADVAGYPRLIGVVEEGDARFESRAAVSLARLHCDQGGRMKRANC